MAVNIDGDTGIDKVQPGSVDGVDLSDGSVSSPKLDTNIAVTGTLSAGGNISTPTGTVTASSFSGDGSSLTGIAGGFSNMEVFTSPGTWTNPGNVQKVKVIVVGGGGNGVNAYPGANISSGGAGGAAIEVVPFPSGTNVSVTVGNAGGTSSFGAYCSATGGTSGASSGPNNAQAIRSGGSGSGGQININGGPGQGSAASPDKEILAGGASIFGGRSYGSGGYSLGDYPPGSPAVPGIPGIVIVEY